MAGRHSASSAGGHRFDGQVEKPRFAELMLGKSTKIKNGSLSVYKLPMTTYMKQKMITRKIIGQPSRVMGEGNEKVLMLVGATGAGKSALINGMVNYIMAVEWNDNFRYKLIIDDDKSQAHSQTRDITAYTFYPMEGSPVRYKFTVIDTPGFGDTEGLKRDKVITEQIREFFSIPPPGGIDHLDGIGFVTQASLPRLTPTQKYIFDSILSIFGKDVAKNIFGMVTFSDNQKPPVVAAIKEAKVQCSKYFKFNNSAFFAENTVKNKKAGSSYDVESDDEESDDEELNKTFWNLGVRSFKKFFAEFAKSKSVSLQLTQEVMNERKHLQTTIEGLSPQITAGINKIAELSKIEMILKKHEAEIEANKSFVRPIEVTKPRKIDLSGTGQHTTTCLRCNYTCHQDCVYADDRDKLHCTAMGPSGDCTVCPKHCEWSEHSNLPYLIKYETVTETITLEILEKRFNIAVSGKTRVQNVIAQIDKELKDRHKKVLTMIVQVQESLRRLDEIALKPNPLTQVDYLEILIESEKSEAKHGWEQRVQYYEEAKRQAKMLSKMKSVDAAEKAIEGMVLSGDSWYSRFQFW